MGGNGSRGTQLTDCLAECRGQRADTRPGVEQDVLGGNPFEKAGHEPGDFRRGEDLPTLLSMRSANAILELFVKI
jgi:hypothetical protein